MTHTPADSDAVGEGVQGETSPQTSTQQSDQPNLTDVDAFVNALEKHDGFNALLGKAVQSQKDRRFDKLERNQNTFAEQLAEFTKLTTGEGAVSHDVALRLMELEGKVEPVPDSVAPQDSPGKADDAPKVDYNAVVTGMGLDPNDPAVTEVIKAGGDPTTKIQAFTLLAQNRVQAQVSQAEQTTNPAGMLPGTGQGTPVDTDKQALLQKEYDAELAKIPFGQIEEIHQLKVKYRGKGLPIW